MTRGPCPGPERLLAEADPTPRRHPPAGEGAVPGSGPDLTQALSGPLPTPPQDQKRMEKISKRVSAIEEVNNNVKLLTEMVMNHSQGGAAARSGEDLMKVRPPPPSSRPPQGPRQP